MSRSRRTGSGDRAAATSSGPAEVHSIRLAPAVHADTLRAAEVSGLPWATWAARQLAEAAAATTGRPRIETLEDVLGMQLERGDVDRLALELGPVLLSDPVLLRGAIAAAWALGRGPEIRAASEKIGASETARVQLTKKQREVLLAIHRMRPHEDYQARVLETLARRELIEHTSLGWRTTKHGEMVASALEQAP